MNDVVVIWLFYPFYLDKAQEFWISHLYENLNSAKNLSIEWYIEYLQDLSNHYHDNIPINQNKFIELLIDILKEYLPNTANTNNKEDIDEEYKKIIYKKLYI